MAEKRKPFPKITTPVGTAVWPRLNEPDYKFKTAGEYQCRLKLSRAEAQPYVDKLQTLAEEAFSEAKAKMKAELADADTGAKKAALKERLAKYEMGSMPFKDDVDDEGEPNGFVVLNFKLPAKVTFKKKDGSSEEKVLAPMIFDAAGKLMKNPPAIWGGSKLCISGEIRPYATPKMAGVSLRLSAVQVVELMQGGQGTDAASHGFAKQDGYTAEEEPSFPAKGIADDAAIDNEDF